MIKKIIQYILLAIIIPVAMVAQIAPAASPGDAGEAGEVTLRQGIFIKPNFELTTYESVANKNIYELDYLTGLAVGYDAGDFNTMLAANYLIKKGLLVISTGADYKLQLGIVHFLVGGEFGLGFRFYEDGVTACTDCKLHGVFAPHLGFAFDIGKNSALGIITKVYINSQEWRAPYYSGGLELRVGF